MLYSVNACDFIISVAENELWCKLWTLQHLQQMVLGETATALSYVHNNTMML